MSCLLFNYRLGCQFIFSQVPKDKLYRPSICLRLFSHGDDSTP